MKRTAWVALLLVVCISISCLAFAEETEESSFVEFAAPLTSNVGYTASEWFDSSISRAALTTLLVAELLSDENAPEIDAGKMLSSTSYVGKDGINLTIVGVIDSGILAISFCPILKQAYWYVIKLDSSPSALMMKTVVDTVGKDGYYENNLEDILKFMQALLN